MLAFFMCVCMGCEAKYREKDPEHIGAAHPLKMTH